jgi:cysteine synthase A
MKSNILSLIGNTPLVEISPKLNTGKAKILAKVEFFNPGGSIKDRVALAMIEDAEKKGILKKGATIIEPTSGNTGVGLALVAAVKGYHLILTMPETMSIERRKLAQAYGAEIVLTEGSLGMKGSVDKAIELQNSIEGSIILQQFENPANPKAHYETTGPEIWKSTNGNIDVLVACVGTGGTISGTAKFLKEKNPEIKIVAVEPEESPLLSKGYAGAHKIQGIGANFIPANLDRTQIDEVITVPSDNAIKLAKEIASNEGILVGISSGAALSAAIALSEKSEYANKTIVTILPDTGERYLSIALERY